MIKRMILFLMFSVHVFAGLDAFDGKVINVADPAANKDAVNLQYLDGELLKYLLIDGTRAMTGNWDVGGFDFTNMDQLQVNTDITVSTMVLATGSITDSGGTIDFNDEDLNTTGLINSVELGSAATDNYWFGDAQTMGTAGSTLSGATDNIAIGSDALEALTSGDNNIAIGTDSLTANTGGNNNIAIGTDSLKSATSSNSNTAIGDSSLPAVTTGAGSNVAVGYLAGQTLTIGFRNTILGKQAMIGGNEGNGNIAVGYLSGAAGPGGPDDNITIGFNTGAALTTGATYNTLIGFGAGDKITTGSDNIAIGRDALDTATTVSNLIAIGQNALEANTSGTDNVAIGLDAGDAIATGAENVFVGKDAGKDTHEGSDSNVYVGINAGQANKGDSNVSIGSNSSLGGGTGQDWNVAIGASAMGGFTAAGSGKGNVAVGFQAVNTLNDGDGNVGIGINAIAQITDGDNNIGIGSAAGTTLTTGSNNTLIGTDTGRALTAADDNNVMLGSFAGKYETGSNSLYIDSLDRVDDPNAKTNSLIYGTFHATPASQTLALNAAVTIPYTLGVTGIGTFERVNIYSPADDGAASLFIANAGDPNNYFRFQDQSDAIGNIIKTSPTGSIIRMDPLPLDNTSAATIGMFRTTETSDGVTLKLYAGDGTDTVGILLEANNGNITTAGEIEGGLGIFTRVNIYSAAGSADLYLSTGGDLTSFGRVYDNGNTQFKIEKTTASDAGSSTIFLNPMPQDGTSSAKIEAFRSTNTVGLRQLTLYKGDGTATKTIILDAGTGDATFAGNLIVEGSNIGIAAKPGLITLLNGTVSINNILEVDSIGPYSASDQDLIELALNSVTIKGALDVSGISRLDGWLGIGTDPTASNLINVLSTQNAETSGEISNQGTDTGSYAGWFSMSDSGTLSILAHGSARTVTRHGVTLGGRNELLSNAAELVIGTVGAGNSVYFGTENVLAMTIDGTTQKISMTSGLDVAGVSTFGDGTNETSISATGDLSFNGTATVWNDANLGAAMLSRPAANQPDEDEFVDEVGADTGIATLAFAIGEKVSGTIEIPHDYKEGSDITFHVHWQGITAPAGGTDNFEWQLTYTVAFADATLDAVTIIDTGDIAYDTQYEFVLSSFAPITGINFDIGDQFLFTLERIAASADDYAGDGLVATVGIHYEADTVGSRTILTK